MARRDAQAADQQASLILSVDNARSADDPFTLPNPLKTLLTERLAALRQAERGVNATQSERESSGSIVAEALSTLEARLRDGYNHLKGVPGYTITAEQRQAAFAAYGWESGELGSFRRSERTLALARQVVAATPTVTPEAARYPAELIGHITAALTRYDANAALAERGGWRAATATRNRALQSLEYALDRVRFSYCAASDERDRTSELAKIGFQPVRPSGQRRTASEPKPTL